MLGVVMLSVIMLSVIMHNVVLLNVIMMSVILLNVVRHHACSHLRTILSRLFAKSNFLVCFEKLASAAAPTFSQQKRRHDTLHNDTQHNGTQHNKLICGHSVQLTQHK
jgi:hypothetical protein